jgi:hypothetical protein
MSFDLHKWCRVAQAQAFDYTHKPTGPHDPWRAADSGRFFVLGELRLERGSLKQTRYLPWLVFLASILLFDGAPSVQAQRGGLVASRNLLELVGESETIVVGRVLSAGSEPHPEFKNLKTVVVTMRVEEAWKGSPGQTFTFRQYVWDFRDAQEALGYKKGGEVLLMMIKPSRYGAGLQQGRFRLQRNPRGRRFVVNSFGNRGLFKGMREQLRQEGIDLSASSARLVRTQQQGAIQIDQFRNLVRQLARAE